MAKENTRPREVWVVSRRRNRHDYGPDSTGQRILEDLQATNDYHEASPRYLTPDELEDVIWSKTAPDLIVTARNYRIPEVRSKPYNIQQYADMRRVPVVYATRFWIYSSNRLRRILSGRGQGRTLPWAVRPETAGRT